MMEKKELITVAEMIKILRIGRTKGYELIAKKKVPFFRIGSDIRIPLNLLKDHVQKAAIKHVELPEFDMESLMNMD